MDKKKIAGIIAAAAAVAFVAAPFTSTLASATSSKVHCYGVNSCKGKSHCKTAENACKGKNSCKGKGWLKESAAKCKKMKGTTEEPKADGSSEPAAAPAAAPAEGSAPAAPADQSK
jgi:hypothetical protein